MSPFHHRAPGVVGAALARGTWAEVILDLEHVEPRAIQAALRTIPNAYGITDAMAAAGMVDGVYRLGLHEVPNQAIVSSSRTARLPAASSPWTRLFAICCDLASR